MCISWTSALAHSKCSFNGSLFFSLPSSPEYFSRGTKNGVARETAQVSWGKEGEGQAMGRGVMIGIQTEGLLGFQSYSWVWDLCL